MEKMFYAKLWENKDLSRKQDIRIEVPPKGQAIMDIITDAGFEAYVVGGCVRDSILGRVPEDWDITTSATGGDQKTFSQDH